MSDQAAFAAALLGTAPCPPGLLTWNGSDPARRFAVYRNNVVVGLIDALADGFPVTRELVGADFFTAMAREFALRQPPRTPVLAWYGDEFPAYIEAYAPAACLPYLADVARLEMQRVQSYHAADADGLEAAQLTAALAAPERLPALRLQLRPSFGVLRSRHAVVSLWGAHQGLLDIASVDTAVPQSALILRSGLDVNVIAIDDAIACLLAHLHRGACLGAAVTAAPAADPAAALALLLRWQAIVGFDWSTDYEHTG